MVNTVDFESTTLGSTPSGSLSSLSSVGRAVDCSSKGQVFDSPREDFSSIAQLVERATVNREVIGSNRVGRAIINELKITNTNSGKRCPLLPKYCFIL